MVINRRKISQTDDKHKFLQKEQANKELMSLQREINALIKEQKADFLNKYSDD